MPLRNPSTVQFGLRIVLPTILVLVGTIATVLVSLDQMAGEVNRIEERLTIRSVEAAVASVERRLGQTHTDYASWDDAVRSLYGTLDQAFVDENYLASTASSTFFDTAYLIDDKGGDVFAYRGGEAVTTPSGKAFGPLLAEMIAQVPADGRTYGVRTGVLKTIWGLEVVAVGPVVPNTSKQPAPPRSRYLVVARAFDEVEVKKLGEDFSIDGLHFVEPNETGAVTLRDPQGTAVGRLTWPPRRLGSEAHARVSPVVLLMLCLIVGVVGGLIAVTARGLRRIRQSEARARRRPA